MEIFSHNKTYDFMAKRNLFVSISLLFIISSFVLIFTKGFNWGIDFRGGTVVQIRFEHKAPIAKIRQLLSKQYEGVSVTNFGSDKEVIIKFPTKVKNSVTKDMGDTVSKLLLPLGKFEVRRVDIVGAKVGDELTHKGLKALLLAIVGILIYVAFRFEWSFALASVLALVHDITISLGFVSLFDVDVNLDVLAALLTILGYSLNDTIVVFDRIREEIIQTKEKNLAKIINSSVSKTLSRTTLTSLTTFFVVLMLFVFGGDIIKPFSFTLLVGVIVGTYSSIFIASPLLIWLKFNVDDFRKNLAEKEKRRREKEKLRAQFEGGVV
ncbi:MAG: protein translocase subunit SecF [Epsilonproteobacteria bacterium]|nr:protein translocase subunit SecF [Campylobacterota bacterium]